MAPLNRIAPRTVFALQAWNMRKRLIAVLMLLAGLTSAQQLSFESLLNEMTDRDRLVSFPDPTYRCLQASSYNRASVPPRGSEGWFADSDGTGFIRVEEHGGRREWVLMEHAGPGCVSRIWTPYFYYDLNDHRGPNIRFYLDGAEEPAIEANFIELLTQGAYANAPEKRNSLRVPAPLAGYTARAGDLYLPVPFGRSCRITLDRKPFYYIINYGAYPDNTSVQTWSRAAYDAAAPRLAETCSALLAATDFAGGTETELSRTIAPGASAALELPPGANAVRHIEVRLLPVAATRRLRSTVLRAVFDGAETIWTPLGDFFCSGEQINPFRTWEREVNADGEMICRWVMPYRESAVISLENLGPDPVDAVLRVHTAPRAWTDASMYFHARWRMDDPVPGTPFQDWNFVDIAGKGVYVGDAWSILCADTGWWGEGDEKIYIDGDYDERQFPSHFGTGTEDYYGWAGGEVPTGADAFSAPFLANVRIGNPANPRGWNICTRTRILDAIPFATRLRFDMEASFGVQMRNPWDLLQYGAVTFWYAEPGASHNCPPLPDWAAQPPMTVEELDARQAHLRNVQQEP